MAKKLKIIFWLLSMLYPFFVYWGLSNQKTSLLIVTLLILMLFKIFYTQQPQERVAVIGLSAVIILITVFGSQQQGLKLYPAMVNFSFLALFGLSLFSRMPIVERIARLQEPELPLHAVRYTRRVTQVWTGFFAINGLISVLTVFAASERIWVFYNGFLAYIFIGIIMLAELLIRRQVRKQDGE